MSVRITGGCQCGAVRYALSEAPNHATICHCRMCQKAFGSYFAPFAGVPTGAFAVTRGGLAVFKSSDQAERGFCRDCGTPLTFRYVERPRISVSLGSLDNPEGVLPQTQCGIERSAADPMRYRGAALLLFRADPTPCRRRRARAHPADCGLEPSAS
jgi:hypothetical protein